MKWGDYRGEIKKSSVSPSAVLMIKLHGYETRVTVCERFFIFPHLTSPTA